MKKFEALGLVVSFVMLIAVGFVVVSWMQSQLGSLPQEPFAIVKKEEKTMRQFWFTSYTIYVFYYDDSHWIEVLKADYDHYNVGDTYPNTYRIVHWVQLP